MLKTYKVLSILLDYPNLKTQELLAQVMPLLEDEMLLNRKALRNILSFIECYEEMDLMEWQRDYSKCFDQAAATSLYLFNHTYGNPKKREVAMIDLKRFYASEGMELGSNKLPDHLPVFLEFIAETQSLEEGANLMAETADVLNKIADSLDLSGSPYRLLMTSLIHLAKQATGESMTEKEKKEDEILHPCEACFFTGKEILFEEDPLNQ